MMIEEIGTTEKPAWLDLPEKSHYWGCGVTYKRSWRNKLTGEKPVWRVLNYSREDAEAYASLTVSQHPGSKWDPAEQRSLAKEMFRVRQDGDLGIIVQSYQGGAWRTVKEYPAGVPLPGEELP